MTFNDDVNEDLINLHHHITPFEAMLTLAKDYRIEVFAGGSWQAVAEVRGNYKRRQVHRLNAAVRTNRLRIVVEATNGSEYAGIVEVRTR